MSDQTSDRCPWCGTDPLYVAYHDIEWGVPEYDSRALFETLMLEGFQAGLSWITILRKREAFRARFEGFEPTRLMQWGEEEIAAALADAGIVRHRGKIEGTIAGARAWAEIDAREGFSRWIWSNVDGVPLQNNVATMAEVPAETLLSKRLSKDLKKAGFKFCGPTIVYAFMQAAGLVNDHLTSCPQHRALGGAGH
ncbi:MAG: DNA-3-methyladenine glycosylase I [Pseudomonadota bacterium]